MFPPCHKTTVKIGAGSAHLLHGQCTSGTFLATLFNNICSEKRGECFVG